MVLSGVDLIRNSGHQQEVSQRLKVVEPVMPVASTGFGEGALGDDTQSALLRFARFIRKKEEDRRRPGSKAAPPHASNPDNRLLPEAYANPEHWRGGAHRKGEMLDICV